MQRILMGAVLAGALAWTGDGQSVAAPAQTSLSVTLDGLPPGTVVEVAMNVGKTGQAAVGAPSTELAAAMNTGKFSGTADAQGMLSGILEIAAVGKIQVQVLIDEQCPDKKVRIYLVSQGQEPPPECKRRVVGWFWLHKARRITIHVNAHTLVVDQTGWSKGAKFGTAGGALAVVTTAIIAGTGSGSSSSPTTTTTGTTTTPTPTPSPAGISATGDYGTNATVKKDDAGHDRFVMGTRVKRIHAAQSVITFTADDPWVTTTGNFDNTTGRFMTTGRGTVAGFQNVGVRFDGTINAAGAIMGDWELGTGGELPTGRSIIYLVQGQRQ
jgi:hypothetical protein